MILGINGILAGKGASPLISGLISMYKAESNELDSYGTNNGSPFGGLLYVTGKQGNGFQFNGSNSYVQLPNNAFSIQDFSISLWYNPSSLNPERTIFANTNGNASPIVIGYYLGTNTSGVLEFFMYDGNSTRGYRYNTLTINTWYNITLTKTQNNAPVMYVNGNVLTPTSYVGIGAINPVYSYGVYTYTTPCIGAFLYNNGTSKANYGSSTTDEIGIWNRELTSTEITELYNSGVGKFYPY